MSPDPKLPRPEVDGWIGAFVTRFYRLWSELVSFLDSITPQYGEWTPTLTFATPGTLAVSPRSDTMGRYVRIGKILTAEFQYVSSAFTLGTASGALRLSGLPVPPATLSNYQTSGTCEFGGITFATAGLVGATQVNCVASSGNSFLQFDASGSGVSGGAIQAADTPTGGTIVLRGFVTYRVD